MQTMQIGFGLIVMAIVLIVAASSRPHSPVALAQTPLPVDHGLIAERR